MGRSRFEAGLLGVLGLSGVGVLGLWQAKAGGPAIGAAGLSALVLGMSLMGALAWRSWWRGPVGQLHWRDDAWFFAPSTSPVSDEPVLLPRLRVALDLQRVLLVEAPGAAPAWFWLERRNHPARWNALRRAVYARPLNPETDAAAQPRFGTRA